MINPEKSFKNYWDKVILLVTIAIAFETPLIIVFKKPASGNSLFFSIFVTIIFTIDIFVNFNTAIHQNGELTFNRSVIMEKYLKGWFWFDLFATIPFDLIFISTPIFGLNRIFRILKLIRLFKLMRIAQTLQNFRSKNVINPSIFRMIMLMFWILIATHFITCGWIMLSTYPDTMTNGEKYLHAIYWAVTTLTTIGYGDITPETSAQIIYVIIIEITGAALYGFIIGNIANLISNIDIAKAQYREKMEKINTFMKYRSIPFDLRDKINNYYTYLWDSRRGYDESSVLKDLPISLKTNVSLFLNKEIIEKVPIFKGASISLIKEIILNLEPVVFTPGDYIVRKGDIGTDMFFISKGHVDVVSEDESIVYATLSEGHFFGEIALLLSSPRTASIRTQTYCDLYRLDKETFDDVLHKYPDFEATIKELAEKRKSELSPKSES